MKQLIVLLISVFLIAPFCKQKTDGFAVTKIASVVLDEKEEPFDSPLLEQKFFYLTKGGQAFVFLSEDGEHVLKVFRGSRLGFLRFFFPLAKQAIAKERKKIEETLHSFSLAKQCLKQETGVVFAHLGQNCQSLPPLQIVDKMGNLHKLDGNAYPFVLQKRAQLVKEKITDLVSQGSQEDVAAAFRSLFTLIDKRIAAGLEDGDPNLAKNFGFVGPQAIEIDGGRLFESEDISFEKIRKSKEDLQHWINKYHPEISPLFDETFQTWIDTHEAL